MLEGKPLPKGTTVYLTKFVLSRGVVHGRLIKDYKGVGPVCVNLSYHDRNGFDYIMPSQMEMTRSAAVEKAVIRIRKRREKLESEMKRLTRAEWNILNNTGGKWA